MERSYWVVSPNVNGSRAGKLEIWQKAIPDVEAAFMGWPPKRIPRDKKNQGPAFAQKIEIGDVILIAQGKNKSKGLLGCGVVSSEAIPDSTGKRPPKLPKDLDYGSYRQLDHFKKLKPGEIIFDGASQNFFGISFIRRARTKIARFALALIRS